MFSFRIVLIMMVAEWQKTHRGAAAAQVGADTGRMSSLSVEVDLMIMNDVLTVAWQQ